jgi:hypothetical protein
MPEEVRVLHTLGEDSTNSFRPVCSVIFAISSLTGSGCISIAVIFARCDFLVMYTCLSCYYYNADEEHVLLFAMSSWETVFMTCKTAIFDLSSTVATWFLGLSTNWRMRVKGVGQSRNRKWIWMRTHCFNQFAMTIQYSIQKRQRTCIYAQNMTNYVSMKQCIRIQIHSPPLWMPFIELRWRPRAMITGFWYKVNGARQEKKETKPSGDRVHN